MGGQVVRRLPNWAKAERKGMEIGAYAWKNPNGTFTVRSATRPDLRHDVMPYYLPTGAIRLECGCESGEASQLSLVPCWHATRVGRRLEREGIAIRGKYGWYLKDPSAKGIPGDPFPGERDQRRAPVDLSDTSVFDMPGVAC